MEGIWKEEASWLGVHFPWLSYIQDHVSETLKLTTESLFWKSCDVAHLFVNGFHHFSCGMGIKGLTGLISELAPAAIKEHDIKTLFGRKVAIDASMSIYQFLIAVRQKDGEMLTNDSGETTSHLMGFFYRTIRIVDNGIKPAYVFDGKPPEMKKGVVRISVAKLREKCQLDAFFSYPNDLRGAKRQRRREKRPRRLELLRISTDSRVEL